MATKSGKDGRVEIAGSAVAAIMSWKLVTKASSIEFVSSSTGGFKTRLPSVKDSSGEIRFKIDFSSPITDQFDEGTLVTLALYLDATRFYSVPAMIESIDLDSVDIDEGSVIGGKATFLGTGPITKPVY